MMEFWVVASWIGATASAFWAGYERGRLVQLSESEKRLGDLESWMERTFAELRKKAGGQ